MNELVATEFSIEERFQFMENYANLVIKSEANSLIVSGNAGLGNSTGEAYNAHLRFYNLRSTTYYKSLTHMDAMWYSNTGHMFTSRKGLNLGWRIGQRTNKVDTIQFQMGSGNITSGTITLYGMKKS